MHLVQELDKEITTVPILMEVSIKGVWEDAWHISYDEGSPSLETIENYLAKGTEEIACEVFFKTDDGNTLFLGIRFNEQLKTTTPKEFLTTFFRSVWPHNSPTFSGMVSDLSRNLTGDAGSLFSIYPTAIELGIVNWWKSMGNVEIWNNQQDKIINKTILKQQLNRFPHLLQNNNNYAGLEFNYQVIPHYWLGIQVADNKEGRWVLYESRLEDLLKKLLGFSIE